MKSKYLLFSVLFLLCFTIKAEERVFERVFVYTDKDCYVAGENILLKFNVLKTNFNPSDLSKVGYLEVCNTEKPLMQLKLALEKGKGAGAIKIPEYIPSGIYQLSGYTQYMRNEGENVFFNKQIAIINVGQQFSDPERFDLVEKFEDLQVVDNIVTNNVVSANLLVKTDQNKYGKRNEVLLTLENIPGNASDLVISVSRNDSITVVPGINRQEWLKQVSDTFGFSKQWLPEYEGHIIMGKIIPEPENNQFRSSIAFVGKDIRYTNGLINNQDGTASFITAGIFGKQQIVSSIMSQFYNKVPYRLDLLSPFCESLPKSLPVLRIFPKEKQLMDRYLGVQIQEKTLRESFDKKMQLIDYYNFTPTLSYNLDEYTRFGSISETILEFVSRVRVMKLSGKQMIGVYSDDRQQYSLRTLVLLDGVPVYNHEDILNYNPMYIKIINVYDGRFMFGNENFECIVSFITHEGNLPFFQLGEGYQLLDYECPQFPLSFDCPDYSINELKNSKTPDFRHTLYWNPFVNCIGKQIVNLSFYTSDLCGDFKVTVEGITTDGKVIYGTSSFKVF